MRIRIIRPGLLSTIQDMGRYGYLPQAVPVSGAMDALSASVANIAVGNPADAAVIEFTYAGAEFVTETGVLICCCGDGAVLMAGDTQVQSERPVFIPQGTKIELTHNPMGSRTYLSVAGGWNVPLVLGSRSTYLTAGFGGLHGMALQAGDVLESDSNITTVSQLVFEALKGSSINSPTWGLGRTFLLPANSKIIRIVPGNEFSWFHGLSLVDFLSEPYTLSIRCNRMGYHLDGPAVNRIVKHELLSTAVTPGTIQVTGNGSMVLLMADCQTTGGYPRIAQVAAVDLPICGQLKPGDSIYFKEITRQDAEMLYIERDKQLQKMAVAVKNKFL